MGKKWQAVYFWWDENEHDIIKMLSGNACSSFWQRQGESKNVKLLISTGPRQRQQDFYFLTYV
jgi:hypothetical protein